MKKGSSPSTKKALKLFGETDDPIKAGWILPSGKLVYWVDCHNSMAEKINDCTADDIIQRGWIRIVNQVMNVNNGNAAGIEISAEVTPTIAQLRKVCELVEQTDKEQFLVEWTTKDGRHLTKEFEPDPEEVLYCMGIMHQTGFEEIYQEKQRRKEQKQEEKGEAK